MNLPVPEGRDTMSGDRSSVGLMAVLATALLLVLAVATNGDIKVTVTDELGSALQGATVEVKCNVIGATYNELSGSPKTGASGFVDGTAVAASKCTSGDDAEGGRIHVRITKDGHKRKTIEDGDTRWYPDVNPNSVTVSGLEYA
ncbi:MAG: hypothetical protein QF415_15895, partial [Candidatus Undinarchaeales archaeon]|nr:hypothetical protein [Candidatus Undinarchaeales archaeon]